MDFAQRHSSIQLLLVFGSQASDRSKPDSDIDIALAIDKALDIDQKIKFQQELETILQMNVDLVDLWDCRGAIFQESMGRGKVILRRNSELYAKLLLKMWGEREDDSRFLQKTVDYRLKKWTP